jgi:hypothetical protein
MVVEHAGGAGVCQDVGIALLQVVAGEGPMVERAAGVVVVNELQQQQWKCQQREQQR